MKPVKEFGGKRDLMRLQPGEEASRDWQALSILTRFTERAAPFKLCASRKMLSTISIRLSGEDTFPVQSAGANGADMFLRSTRKVARSLFRNS